MGELRTLAEIEAAEMAMLLPPELGGATKEPAWLDRRRRLLERLVELERESPGRVSLSEFCRAAGVSETLVQRRFGGWRRLRAAAGLPAVRDLRGRGQVHSREALIASLKKLAQGRPLTEREFCAKVGVSTTTIERHCGSWRALRAMAGMRKSPRRHRDIGSLEISLDLHRVIRTVGRFPTMQEIDQHGVYGSAVHLKRGGSPEAMRQSHERFVVWLHGRMAELEAEGWDMRGMEWARRNWPGMNGAGDGPSTSKDQASNGTGQANGTGPAKNGKRRANGRGRAKTNKGRSSVDERPSSLKRGEPSRP
jgi:AcrR family transcriptional regulator